MAKVAKPKSAATVILLRRAESKGFEVFLTRRPEGMPFLGGMYCYPGGKVTDHDAAPSSIKLSTGITPAQARALLGAQLSPSAAMGIWIAAIREVFEETGVLFAVDPSATPLSSQQLAAMHAALVNHSLTFTALLERAKLRCDLAALAPFAHWQTPAQVAMRFATRFFIAALPPEQTPLASSHEVTHSLWLTADRAMELFHRGKLPMIFPTLAALRSLADFETLESVLREFGLRE